MRTLAALFSRLLAPALVLFAIVLLAGSAPDPLNASECVRLNEHLCRSNESCVKFDLVIWEYNQCTTTHEYGTLVECKYCHA